VIGRLTILGVGLIGGSLARALRDAGHVQEIVGFGRGLGNLQRAVELGVVDRIEPTLNAAVRDADVVFVSTPVGGMPELFAAMSPYLRADALVTDAGSVKGSVVAAARRSLGDRFPNFVPGHPIAGTERSGVEASFSSLFVGRRVVLTPVSETRTEAVARIRAMWVAAGADVVNLSVDRHDELFAATSHLPHILAFALVDLLAQMKDSAEILSFAAGGFRDMTRIASSDPVMWRDICLANGEAIEKMIKSYRKELDQLAKAVANGDAKTLETLFGRAKLARDRLPGSDPVNR